MKFTMYKNISLFTFGTLALCLTTPVLADDRGEVRQRLEPKVFYMALA